MMEIARIWIKRKPYINSDYAITAWALLTLPEIHHDVKLRFDRNKRTLIKGVIKRLLSPLTDSKKEKSIDTFWNEFKDF